MTHICVSKLVHDLFGEWPVLCSAQSHWTNADLLLIRSLGHTSEYTGSLFSYGKKHVNGRLQCVGFLLPLQCVYMSIERSSGRRRGDDRLFLGWYGLTLGLYVWSDNMSHLWTSGSLQAMSFESKCGQSGCCRNACQISERYCHFDVQSLRSATSQVLPVTRLTPLRTEPQASV